MSAHGPLEPDAAEMRRLVDGALARLIPYIESLPRQPAHDVEGAERAAAALVAPMPESGLRRPSRKAHR